MSSFKRMAFQVENEEQAGALQEYLFSLGYTFQYNLSTKQLLQEKVFTTSEDGIIRWSSRIPQGVEKWDVKYTTKLVVETIEKERGPFTYNDGSVELPEGTLIEVIYRDGYTREGKVGHPDTRHRYGINTFTHKAAPSDIIAYRLI